MQPKLCTKCKKNMAVVFITKIENGQTVNEGLCLKCAKELGIKPINDMMSNMGVTDEELENLSCDDNGKWLVYTMPEDFWQLCSGGLIRYDEDTEEVLLGEFDGGMTDRLLRVPLLPRPCDGSVLRLEMAGDWVIHAVMRTYERRGQ